MKYLWIFLTCLAIGPLAAETIENVEYSVPQGWKIANELHGTKKTKVTTLIYVPEQASLETTEEFFGVCATDMLVGPTDQASLEMIMQRQFPEQKIEVSILERDAESVLFEWTVGEGSEKTQGWTRSISSPNGFVMFMYHSGKTTGVEERRSYWVPLLKAAYVKSP